jgi:hypothetical protein
MIDLTLTWLVPDLGRLAPLLLLLAPLLLLPPPKDSVHCRGVPSTSGVAKSIVLDMVG